MTLRLPTISINAPVQEIADCMERSDGVLLIEDLPPTPFEPILNLLQHSPDVTRRLNKAVPEALIYKDVDHAKQSIKTDRKCSLDLSPERLASIAKIDPDVVEAEALQEPLEFYRNFQETIHQKLVPALAKVVGHSFESMENDLTYSYRMIDYYPSSPQPEQAPQQQRYATTSSPPSPAAPRLAEHRDFGFLTLIQQSHPGLQVKINNQWQDVPSTPNGTAILMGGWCARVRTNNRFTATLHRVPKCFTDQERISAVLFLNPKRVDTALDPIVRPGEDTKFIATLTATDLQQRLVEAKTESAVDKWLEVKPKRKNGFWNRFRRQ
jgi:isopenicillin N synthase-like dioxygenase